jgi:hypothetical protein
MKIKYFWVSILLLFVSSPVFAKEYSFLNEMAYFIREFHVAVMASIWILALVIGFIVVYVWKKRMNTAHLKTQADDYVVPGSLNYRTQKDSFLYSTVTKTRRQTQSTGSVRR